MKKLLTYTGLAILLVTGMAIAPITLESDKGEEIEQQTTEEIKVTYVLRFDESSYGSFVRQTGERGVSPADFGRWIAGNGTGSVQIGRDGGYAQIENSKLIIMKIDRSGRILAEQSVNVSLSERGEVLRSPQIAAVIDRMFPGNILYMGDSLISDGLFAYDAFYPVRSIDNAKRAFQQNATRYLGRPPGNVMSETADLDNMVGIGMMLWPDTSRMDDADKISVQPSGGLFILIPDQF
ncbi:MAG: hypothetical protein EA391_03705 [Balneolaceae bacterium]|nr:MAG: hypothetical protein EA391_03705 [Balneolaceae bacterium]